MNKIKSTEDLVVVPKSYFEGMTKRLETLVEKIEIHDFETMEQILYLRDWLVASKVDREIRKLHPNIQWDNIHLLLPPKENCPYQGNCQKDNECFQQ